MFVDVDVYDAEWNILWSSNFEGKQYIIVFETRLSFSSSLSILLIR